MNRVAVGVRAAVLVGMTALSAGCGPPTIACSTFVSDAGCYGNAQRALLDCVGLDRYTVGTLRQEQYVRGTFDAEHRTCTDGRDATKRIVFDTPAPDAAGLSSWLETAGYNVYKGDVLCGHVEATSSGVRLTVPTGTVELQTTVESLGGGSSRTTVHAVCPDGRTEHAEGCFGLQRARYDTRVDNMTTAIALLLPEADASLFNCSLR
jgi:hypothetical protein